MKLITQNENQQYCFLVARDELYGIRYSFTGFDEINISSVWLKDFEKKFDIESGVTLWLYSYILAPAIEGDKDVHLCMGLDEIFILTYFLFNESLLLGIDCGTLSGTPFEEVYSMIFIFVQILQTTSYCDISDSARNSRHAVIDEIISTFEDYRPYMVEHEEWLMEKYGLPRFQEKSEVKNLHLEKYAEYCVEIPNMTGNSSEDEKIAMNLLGIDDHDYDREKWVWHYGEDGKTMQLLPRSIYEVYRDASIDPFILIRGSSTSK